MTTRPDLSDEGYVAEADERARMVRDQEIADMDAVLSTHAGQRLMWRILGLCRVNGSVYAASPNDMYYNAGRQDLGHLILGDMVTAAPQVVMQLMINERIKNAP